MVLRSGLLVQGEQGIPAVSIASPGQILLDKYILPFEANTANKSTTRDLGGICNAGAVFGLLAFTGLVNAYGIAVLFAAVLGGVGVGDGSVAGALEALS